MNLAAIRSRIRDVTLETTGDQLPSRFADTTTDGVTALNDWVNESVDDHTAEVLEFNPTYRMIASDITYLTDALSLEVCGMGTPRMPSEPFRILAIDDIDNEDEEEQVPAGIFWERWSDDVRWLWISGTAIRLRPVPDTDTDIRIYWFNQPLPLVADAQSPWFPAHLHWSVVYDTAVAILEPTGEVTPWLERKAQKWRNTFRNYMGLRQSQEAERLVPTAR